MIFVLSSESFFLEVRKWKLEKLIEKFFLLKAIFCTRSKQFWQPFQKLWLKIRYFFWWILEQTFRKNFVRWTKTFLKSSNVHFDCSLDTPAKKFLPKVQNQSKNRRKVQKKTDFFTQNFHLVYYELALERKRKEYFSNTFANEKKCTLKPLTMTWLLWNEFSKRFSFTLSKFARKKFFSFENLKFWRTVFLRKHTLLIS